MPFRRVDNNFFSYGCGWMMDDRKKLDAKVSY